MKRRPKKNAKRTQVIIRCSEAEKRRWFAEAEKHESGEFSEWAREKLNESSR